MSSLTDSKFEQLGIRIDLKSRRLSNGKFCIFCRRKARLNQSIHLTHNVVSMDLKQNEESRFHGSNDDKWTFCNNDKHAYLSDHYDVLSEFDQTS